MDILRVVGEIPDMHTEKVRKAISKKKVKDFIKYKEMFIENGQKNLQESEEYVNNLWDQIESFAEYGFNASHAYAYSYISARLLWLKAHYPLEFYASILMCETDTDKFKEYKLDAQRHGINVLPVNINKSKQNFSINGNDIYFGFSNIKTIGEEVANRIVEHQPYANIADFLSRFGTDVTPVKALTALGVFEDNYDRVVIRKFADWYKKQSSSRKDRYKRFQKSLETKDIELKELLTEEMNVNDPDFNKACQFTDDALELWEQRFAGLVRQVAYTYKGEQRLREVTFIKQLQNLYNKRKSSIENFERKEREDDEFIMSIDNFNPNTISLNEDEEKILTDELVIDGKKSYPLAESMYYGFKWMHILETCPKYRGFTFDNYFDEVENNKNLSAGPIDIEIINVRKRKSKKDVEFYSLDVEDANSKRMVVNVWKEDYTRFKEEFIVGNLLTIKVNPPSGGFNTFTFSSYPKNQRKNIPEKQDDGRVSVIKVVKKEEKKKESLKDISFSTDFVDII
jgi:DNA polymerase III alpha subunit